MYFVKEIISGPMVEVVKSFTMGMVKNHDRSGRIKKTPEEVMKINERNAVKELARKIACNFQDGDIWLTLTYRKEKRPTPERAKKELSRCLRRVGYRFKKAGCELKWIAVTEYESKAIHHHLVVNNPDALNVAKILCECWKENGIAHIKPLYSQGDYRALAEYMVKETKKTFRENGGCRKRWSCSRNLAKPIVKYRLVRKAKRWTPNPKAKKGYRIDTDSIVNGVNKWTGKEYQSYTMVRLE